MPLWDASGRSILASEVIGWILVPSTLLCFQLFFPCSTPTSPQATSDFPSQYKLSFTSPCPYIKLSVNLIVFTYLIIFSIAENGFLTLLTIRSLFFDKLFQFSYIINYMYIHQIHKNVYIILYFILPTQYYFTYPFYIYLRYRIITKFLLKSHLMIFLLTI